MTMNESASVTTDEAQNSTEECVWCLNEELVGPVIATFTGVILILSFITNLFICSYTLSHPKSLKKSSTIFLFNLALINLLMTVLFMPFMVVASAAEEWIIEQTDNGTGIICQITAFIFAYTVGISLHTLAAISFDRFLSITKPHHHKKYMTWKVALGIVIIIWVYSIFVDITPFFGLGEYRWSGAVGACVPIWGGNTDYVIFFSVLSTIPFTIIIVTTIWTYIFTRRFLKKDFKRRTTMSQNEVEQLRHEKSVYNVRIRNLFGVFGMLLLFNVITFSPYITASLIGLIIGFNNVPSEVYATALILFLLNNVTNSIIQAYFRRDLRECIVKFSGMLLHCFTTKCCSISKTIHKAGSQHPERQESLNGSPQIVVSDARSKHELLNYSNEGKPVNVLSVKSQEQLTTVSELSSEHGGSQSLLLDNAPPGYIVNSTESIIVADNTVDTNNGNLAES